jgi:hypothetical protein
MNFQYLPNTFATGDLRGCILALSLTGDRKVPGTRRQECRRYVAQAFQPAGLGDFPVAGLPAAYQFDQNWCQDEHVSRRAADFDLRIIGEVVSCEPGSFDEG